MSDVRSAVLMVLLAAAVFVGVRAALREDEASARREASGLASISDPPGTGRAEHVPLTEIAALLRSMKLVTVEIETVVRSERLDDSWRGDVAASVAAPARLLYGCDLSGIGEGGGGSGADIRPHLLSGGYTLRVPRPERIAAEIEGDRARAEVRVGWGRFRDLSGEYHLGLARTGLYQQAREIRLSPEQQTEVEGITREQLTTLVRAFSGAGREDVRVEFFDPPAAAAVEGVP